MRYKTLYGSPYNSQNSKALSKYALLLLHTPQKEVHMESKGNKHSHERPAHVLRPISPCLCHHASCIIHLHLHLRKTETVNTIHIPSSIPPH